MALNLVAEPNALSLAQDDMKLHLETDKFQTVVGDFAVIQINFLDYPVNNDYLEITLGDGEVIRMTCKTSPDDSGEQFQEQTSSPSLGVYVAATIVNSFKANHAINSRFVVTKDPSNPYLILTARERRFDWSATLMATNTTGVFAYVLGDGIDPVYNENFEVGVDIYMEDGYRTEEFVKLPTVYAKPLTTPADSATKAVFFNLSERVRRYLSNYDPEILESTDILNIIENVNTRYYYEFFEFYGSSPVAKKVYRSDVQYALYGALNFIDYTQSSYWYTGWYFDATVYPLTRWLSWLPDVRYVPKKQPCWISWLNNHDRAAHSNEDYYLRVEITYTDNTTHYFDAVTDSDSDQWETLCFKCGYEQLGLEGINPAKVVKKWTVWIDHETPSRAAITTSITFVLIPDNHLQRFFVYPNSFGCPESIRVIGRQSTVLNIRKQSFWRHVGMDYGKFERQRKSSFKSYSKSFSGSTGTIKDRDQLHQVIELLSAEDVFIYDEEKDRFIAVEIINEQAEFEKDDDYIYGVSLEWVEAFENKKFSARLPQ